jgi:hypothetical protein
MKRIFTVVVVLTMTYSTFAQVAANYNTVDVLEWNEYYDLNWSDFMGTRPDDAAGDAGTVVQIKAKPFMVKDEIHYDVFALFVKSKSWAEAKAPTLLAHERLHFDIAELYARKIRQRIAELKADNVKKPDVIKLAIQELLQESNEVDMQYDVETLHGAMQSKQAEWEKRVATELAELNKYRKKKRVISAGS